MLVLISLPLLLLFLSFFNKKEEPESPAKLEKEDPESTAKERKASDKTIERRCQRKRQLQRQRDAKHIQPESKVPDAAKINSFIKGLRGRLRPNRDHHLTNPLLIQAKMLRALSNFLLGQRTGCLYHDAFLRDMHHALVGYAVIPNCKTMRMIVKFMQGNILSLGSGMAAFEACIQLHLKHSQVIFCTDIYKQYNPFMHVHLMNSVTAVTTLGKSSDTCLICCPDLNNHHTLEALQTRIEPFPCIIYVGEPRGGCCANDEFFNYLEENYSLKKWVATKDFWNGGIFVYHLNFDR
jgi:hypothetical protein